MPYCSKCGAKLGGEEAFCPRCGASVISLVAEPLGRRERKPIGVLAIALIALITVAVVIAAVATFALLPIQIAGPVTRQMSVPSASDVNVLNFNLTADIAGVNISFEDLSGEWQSPSIILNASATAKVGAFGSSDFLERFMPVWHDETEGDVLTVTVRQDVDMFFWPHYSSLNVTFDVRIDSSMNSSLNVRVSTGGIVVETQAGVVLDSVALEVTTGSVETRLVKDVVVSGDVSATVTTGSVRLFWKNVIVAGDVQVEVLVTTGGVEVTVEEYAGLQGDITLNAEVTTGGVDFAIDIMGDAGAMITSSVTVGGVDVDRRVGFSGPDTALQSSNYPADHNFNVHLRTTTGGIDIDAEYTHSNIHA